MNPDKTILAALLGLVVGLVIALTLQNGTYQLAQAPEQSAEVTRIDLASQNWPAELSQVDPINGVTGTLRRGETLSALLRRLGVSAAEAHAAITELAAADLIDPRRIQRGQEIRAFVDAEQLIALDMPLAPGRRAFVKRTPAGAFLTTQLNARVRKVPVTVRGEIKNSLYVDAIQAGVEDQKIVDFAGVFAFDLDFQREIHPGDQFEMIYERYFDERGEPVRSGALLYVSLQGKSTQKSYYRFTPSDDGTTDYFQANGESATRFLMKTPVNGARLSSRFGTRRHPISGYTRLHKGTDFAAPTGTPIYAAGNGVIERASRYGGYGHYIRIRHANGYKTAYAHLSRYARGVRKGTRVRQGQTIGFVGSTGASTGPHLHYEVYRNGTPLDVMRLNLPTGRKLAETPEILAAFELERERLDAIRRSTKAKFSRTANLLAPAP